MKKTLIAALFTVAAAPAFAEPSCNPGEMLKPVWESIQAFEEEGATIIAFKINGGGCYEIYGNLDDTNMEVFFDPNTGEEIDRIED